MVFAFNGKMYKTKAAMEQAKAAQKAAKASYGRGPATRGRGGAAPRGRGSAGGSQAVSRQGGASKPSTVVNIQRSESKLEAKVFMVNDRANARVAYDDSENRRVATGMELVGVRVKINTALLHADALGRLAFALVSGETPAAADVSFMKIRKLPAHAVAHSLVHMDTWITVPIPKAEAIYWFAWQGDVDDDDYPRWSLVCGVEAALSAADTTEAAKAAFMNLEVRFTWKGEAILASKQVLS